MKVNDENNNLLNHMQLPIIGIFLGILFWITDTLIDIFLFDHGDSFFENLISPEPAELWMRFLVIIMLVLFSLYAKKILTMQDKTNMELLLYKTKLERIVELRTQELEKANSGLKEEISQRKTIEKNLEILAATDPLTSLFNRRKFNELLDYGITRTKQNLSSLSLIFCDIDFFKQLNDNYGHEVGDDVLIQFSFELNHYLHESDTLARWGGEEFAILITDNSSQSVSSLAEKIRKKIEDCNFKEVGKVTASFGVTHYLQGDTKKELFERADKALYMAKESGRNKVVSI